MIYSKKIRFELIHCQILPKKTIRVEEKTHFWPKKFNFNHNSPFKKVQSHVLGKICQCLSPNHDLEIFWTKYCDWIWMKIEFIRGQKLQRAQKSLVQKVFDWVRKMCIFSVFSGSKWYECWLLCSLKFWVVIYPTLSSSFLS